MQPSYPFFSPFPLPIFLTFSSTQIYSHSLSCICSHHTHFFSLFPPLKYLLIMQPSYPFFSPFHPVKYLLIISHAYAAIIPIFLTFSSTQISSHSLSCVCSPHACFFPRSSILGGSQIVCLLTTPSRAHAHGHLWHAIPPPHFIIFNSSYFDIKINFQIFNF